MMQIIVAVIVAVTLIIITYFKRAFSYWKNRNVPYVEPTIPFGTAENPFRRKTNIGIYVKRLYDELKAQGHKHGGAYLITNPQYLPIDPEYIKSIIQRDFDHFTDRGFYYNEKDDPLSANLFALGGHRWRNLRTKLTPTFTSGKMKVMFDTLVQCGYQMQEAMDNLHQNKQAVDIKEILGCFTTDIIGSCAFGLECNSFKSPDAEFRKYGKKIFDPMTRFRSLQLAISFSKPNLGRSLGIRFFPKETSDFFMGVVSDTVKYRETSNFVRKDMLQILIDLKNELEKSGKTESLTIEEVAAQAMIFFAAGFETSSTTMTFCLYELASNQEIQQKVRDEINQVLAKHDGKITYDAIMDMKYMNQVVDETLRKYPPLPFITRECVKDYSVPGTETVLEKGIHIIISVYGLHHDPEFYPDPDKFDPERFAEKRKHEISPFTYMPFGEGPRICIGLRFGLMQTKVGLAILLKNFKFSLNAKTVVPVEMDPFSFILTSKTGIFLDTKKVQE